MQPRQPKIYTATRNKYTVNAKQKQISNTSCSNKHHTVNKKFHIYGKLASVCVSVVRKCREKVKVFFYEKCLTYLRSVCVVCQSGRGEQKIQICMFTQLAWKGGGWTDDGSGGHEESDMHNVHGIETQ